jgi:two-component system sensor histidine kinase and response regulator WspE
MNFGDDSAMMELFREEVRAHAAALSQGLIDLEAAATPQRIEPLMRAAHSIKGAARIVNVEPAVWVAHALEDAFVAAQAGRFPIDQSAVDVFLRATDLLASLGQLEGGATEHWAAEHADDVARLRELLTAIATGRPAVPEAIPPLARASAARPGPTDETGDTEKTATGAVPGVAPVSTPSEPTPEQPPGAAESVIRVTAQSLNRLMGLAGESLVQARWLQPFATALLKLRKQQDQLASTLERLDDAVQRGERPDRLLGLVAEARAEAAGGRQVLGRRSGEFEEHARQAEELNSRLYHEVIVSRMRPFADGVQGFPRLVRDLARRLGKAVRLEVVGSSVPVDRDILERLEAPLSHLLRNAVDHGVEMPAERMAAGKPETALVRLEARHRAGALAITVSDDGRGVDLEQLRSKVVERGHAAAEMARSLREQELLEFLFLPGFSTATAVSELSGRGVGLDVVQDTARKVGGSVHVTTRLGAGTAFHLQLPLTLSVLRAVLVDVAGEPYAFPHNRIDRLLRVPHSDVRSLEHRQFVTVDGQNIGLVLAAQLFDIPGEPPSEDLSVVLLGDASGQYGLVVDSFRGEQDLVVRPLDPRLGKVPDISAASTLDDGTPVLIADVEDLIRSMDRFIQDGTLRRSEPKLTGEGRRKRVLVVDDSITVREVERQLLRVRGYEVEVAVDGQEGWNAIRAGEFDLLVTDVDMPRMDGLELVRLVRADPELRELPIVIISYKDREEDRMRGLELGVNRYLTKGSFHDDTFLGAVADLIGEA